MKTTKMMMICGLLILPLAGCGDPSQLPPLPGQPGQQPVNNQQCACGDQVIVSKALANSKQSLALAESLYAKAAQDEQALTAARQRQETAEVVRIADIAGSALAVLLLIAGSALGWIYLRPRWLAAKNATALSSLAAASAKLAAIEAAQGAAIQNEQQKVLLAQTELEAVRAKTMKVKAELASLTQARDLLREQIKDETASLAVLQENVALLTGKRKRQ